VGLRAVLKDQVDTALVAQVILSMEKEDKTVSEMALGLCQVCDGVEADLISRKVSEI